MGLGWAGNNSSLALRPTLHKESKDKVQLKSSIPIGAKVEISPKGFTLGVKAEILYIYIYIYNFFNYLKKIQSAPSY